MGCQQNHVEVQPKPTQFQVTLFARNMNRRDERTSSLFIAFQENYFDQFGKFKHRRQWSALHYELLSYIISLMVQSPDGAENLARAIFVSKALKNVIAFNNASISNCCKPPLWQSSSLLNRCALVGNMAAQFLLAKEELIKVGKFIRNFFNEKKTTPSSNEGCATITYTYNQIHENGDGIQYELLTYVMILMVQSPDLMGAQQILRARTLSVSRTFLKLAQDENVLKRAEAFNNECEDIKSVQFIPADSWLTEQMSSSWEFSGSILASQRL